MFAKAKYKLSIYGVAYFVGKFLIHSLLNTKTMVDFKKGVSAKPNMDKPKIDAVDIHAALVIGAKKPDGMEKLTSDDLWEIMDAVPDEHLEDLSGGEYFDFNKMAEGETISVLATSARTANLDGKDVPIVGFETRDGKKYIAGATLLVQAVKNCKQLPVYLRVTMLGKKKSAGGNYFDLQIKTIPVPAF